MQPAMQLSPAKFEIRQIVRELKTQYERISGRKIKYPIEDPGHVFSALFDLDVLYDDQGILNSMGEPLIGCLFPDGEVCHPWRRDKLIVVNMTPMAKEGGLYVYYHCSNSKGKCRQPYLREEMTDQLFLEQAIKPVALTPKQVDWLREGLRKSFQDQTAYHKARISTLQARLEQLQRRLDQIYLDKLDGKVSEEFWEANTGAWRKEQEEIRQTVSQHERANIHFFEDGIKLFELAKDLPAKYVMATDEEKREILAFLASNYTITDLNLSPVYGKPFCWFAEYVKTEKWGG